MISRIRELAPAQQRQLIELLHEVLGSPVKNVADDDLPALLVKTLRNVLDVPDKGGDLPEYLRRRLVEVVRWFELAAEPDSLSETDLLTDMELAQTLVGFILKSAALLKSDDHRRKDLDMFLRTKSQDQRQRWLVATYQYAAYLSDVPFDEADSESRARAVRAGGKSHEETAKALVSNLSTEWQTRPWRPMFPPGRLHVHGRSDASTTATAGAVGSADVASAPASAAMGGGAVAVGGIGAGAALLATAALPLGAVAGALFMAGRARRELKQTVEAENVRRLRARRSKLVQAVITIAAFMVAEATTPGAPAVVA